MKIQTFTRQVNGFRNGTNQKALCNPRNLWSNTPDSSCNCGFRVCGNTFAAIARILVKGLNLESMQEQVARSLSGHIVIGVAGDEEANAFRKFCESLE